MESAPVVVVLDNFYHKGLFAVVCTNTQLRRFKVENEALLLELLKHTLELEGGKQRYSRILAVTALDHPLPCIAPPPALDWPSRLEVGLPVSHAAVYFDPIAPEVDAACPPVRTRKCDRISDAALHQTAKLARMLQENNNNFREKFDFVEVLSEARTEN